VIEAEVRYALREEFARSVADVSRRTRLGLGACGGMRCAARCGAIVAEEMGYPPSDGMRDALRFLTRQARTRVCALGPEQARQEALVIASVRSQMGIVGSASLTPPQSHATLVTEAARSDPAVASLDVAKPPRTPSTPSPPPVAVGGDDV
jgi:hypothetical protein